MKECPVSCQTPICIYVIIGRRLLLHLGICVPRQSDWESIKICNERTLLPCKLAACHSPIIAQNANATVLLATIHQLLRQCLLPMQIQIQIQMRLQVDKQVGRKVGIWEVRYPLRIFLVVSQTAWIYSSPPGFPRPPLCPGLASTVSPPPPIICLNLFHHLDDLIHPSPFSTFFASSPIINLDLFSPIFITPS